MIIRCEDQPSKILKLKGTEIEWVIKIILMDLHR